MVYPWLCFYLHTVEHLTELLFVLVFPSTKEEIAHEVEVISYLMILRYLGA